MSSSKGDQVLERAVDEVLRRRHDRFLAADTLRDEALELQTLTNKEERKLVRQVPTKMAEYFANVVSTEGQKALDDLLLAWDEAGKGKISRNQFAISLRTIMPVTDVAANDLFDRFSDYNKANRLVEKPMEIEMGKLISSVKRLIDTSTGERANLTMVRQRCETWRAQAEVAIRAADTTDLLDHAADEVQRMKRETTLENKLGYMIIRRGLKPVDVVDMWTESEDDDIDMEEFAHHVRALGVQADATEIDSLFEVLDRDHSGLLDKGELKNALVAMETMAVNHKKRVQTLYMHVMELADKVRRAQDDWHRAQREDDDMPAEEGEVGTESGIKSDIQQRKEAAQQAAVLEAVGLLQASQSCGAGSSAEVPSAAAGRDEQQNTAESPSTAEPSPKRQRRMAISAEAGRGSDDRKEEQVTLKVFPKSAEARALIASVVRVSALFAGVTSEQQEQMIDVMQELQVPKGETIIRQGGMYALLECAWQRMAHSDGSLCVFSTPILQAGS